METLNALMQEKGYMLALLQQAAVGLLMWKDDCGVLGAVTAHCNCSGQRLDMVHLPSESFSISWTDERFHPS